MSDTMEEGVIAVWHKKVGDKVDSGELMAEIETDKATMDYESYNEGTVLYLGAAEGDAVAVDGVLAIVGEAGEDYQALLNGSPETASTPKAEESTEAAPSAAPSEKIDTSSINAEIVRMPKMSDTMEEGTISAWHKKVGDTVESGELMAEVDTDKATMEYESYNDGTVLYLGAAEGEAVKVDGILAIVGEPGADYETLIKAEAQSGVEEAPAQANEAPAPAAAPAASSVPAPEPTAAPVATTTSNGRIKASPLAKRLASEKGIDISQVPGSGEGGRIVKRDVEGFVPAAAPVTQPAAADAPAPVQLPTIVGEESFEEVKLSQMRKVIARRLGESKFAAPHFYLTMEINMDKAIEARKSMNEVSPVKISFNDMVIKAAAVALRKHPGVNSSWLEDRIRTNHHVHIGVAVAVDEGLLVPVVRFADNKPLSHISAEVKDLGGKAKSKKLQPQEMEGNTFTISNLGMFGIEEFTAIINPPDACIMAVGGIKQTAIVKDGQLAIGNIMKVTMSCDHRVVDGAVGSAFLQTFKSLLEDPVRILV